MVDRVVGLDRLVVVVVTVEALNFRTLLVGAIVAVRAVLLLVAGRHDRTHRPFVLEFDPRFTLDVCRRRHRPVALVHRQLKWKLRR